MTGSTYEVWGWGGTDEEPREQDLRGAAPVFQALLGFPVQPPGAPGAARAPAPTRLAARGRRGRPGRARGAGAGAAAASWPSGWR